MGIYAKKSRLIEVSFAFLPLALFAAGCDRGTLVSITSSFGLLDTVRPALSEDGQVAWAQETTIQVGDGTITSTLDLAPLSLRFGSTRWRHPLKLRNGGEVIFSAERTGAPACPTNFRGAYRANVSGGSLITYYETCPTVTTDGAVAQDLAISPNGTVAMSHLRDGQGAIRTGPSAGPLNPFRTGTGEFYNVGDFAVSDSGRVAVQMEYFDGFAGGLMRGILVFDYANQSKAAMSTAIEKLGIGARPQVAVNSAGTVAFSLESAAAFTIAGTAYNFSPGIYIATPTLFNTPKAITKIADLSGEYCRFGAVDINDAGRVVFEAAIDGELGCIGGTSPGTLEDYDGIFDGADPASNALIRRGQSRLGGHQYFDSIYLGEINNAGQVAFMTTYSEPLVPPYMVWRLDP